MTHQYTNHFIAKLYDIFYGHIQFDYRHLQGKTTKQKAQQAKTYNIKTIISKGMVGEKMIKHLVIWLYQGSLKDYIV